MSFTEICLTLRTYQIPIAQAMNMQTSSIDCGKLYLKQQKSQQTLHVPSHLKLLYFLHTGEQVLHICYYLLACVTASEADTKTECSK